MSMNILFHGKRPATPMHELHSFDEQVWLNEVLPNLTDEPLASIDGTPVVEAVGDQG